MSLFICSKCKCVENTALCNYWLKGKKPPLCSKCDPKIKKWHKRFKREFPKKEEYRQIDSNFIERKIIE